MKQIDQSIDAKHNTVFFQSKTAGSSNAYTLPALFSNQGELKLKFKSTLSALKTPAYYKQQPILSFLSCLLAACFCLLFIKEKKFFKKFSYLLSLHSFDIYSFGLFNKVLIWFIATGSISLMSFFSLHVLFPDLNLNLTFFYILVLFYTGFFITKLFLSQWVGTFFNSSLKPLFSTKIIYQLWIYAFVFSLPALIILLFGDFSDLRMQNFISKTSIVYGFWGCLFIYLLVVFTHRSFSILRIRSDLFLDIILYICTLEIIPILVLFKLSKRFLI